MGKKTLTAKDDTPEEYDEYFHVLKNLTPVMTVYRTKKGVGLIGNKRGDVLSIGVGNLGEAGELKKSGFDVTVCDISPSAIQHAEKNGFKAFQCDITKSPPNGKYDFIFCMEVLEHLVNPLNAIKNLRKSLNQTGRLVISLPNEFNFWNRFQILLGNPPFGGHDFHHLRFFNRRSGEKMFADAHLQILARDYCPRIPLWNRASILIGELLQKLMPNLFSYNTVWLLKPE